MSYEALLFTLSALGISETVYLIKKRLLSQKPICPIGEDCTKVLSSKYSTIFLVPNDVLGLVFYIICSLITAFLVIGIEPMGFWKQLISWLLLGGSLMSVYFTYLQFQVIRALCFWCLMSALTIWSMGVIIMIERAT